MNFWIIAIGEPISEDIGTPRLLRAGMLSSQIAASGIDVTWWNSSFDHTQKVVRNVTNNQGIKSSSYSLRLLKGRPYRSNVSIARIHNHLEVASDFSRCATAEVSPDLIFVAYPTIELCESALAYARPRDIPVVVDIRDLWPDIFVNLFPRWAQWLARILLTPFFRSSKRVLIGANAITGITDSFVDWGVKRAARPRHEWDRAFPLAYKAQLADSNKIDASRAHWDSLGLGADKPIVCFFGTLGRQFDIPCVIEAARHLVDVPLQFVICGSGERLAEFRQLAIDLPNVHFPGWVDAPAINALMERSLAGLAPYYNEMSFTLSLPNKVIEYLAGGLPIVSTLSGELANLLNTNECGVTTTQGDSQSLSAALRNLLTDPMGREKMAKNARDLYKRQFMSEVVYGQLIDHLSLIATQHRQGQKPISLARLKNPY